MSDNPKLKVIHGHAYASSLDIARHFHKRHADVLRAIESRLRDCSEDFNQRNFASISHTDRRNREQKSFNLTRDGFAFIAMSFTGREAAVWQEAYITAFNEMEAEIQRRNVKDGSFEQMNLFPGLRDAIGESRPTISVTGALTVLGYEGLMIPLVTRDQIVRMIKRGSLEGFNDGRNWQVYQDSFETFLKHRRGSVAKAA